MGSTCTIYGIDKMGRINTKYGSDKMGETCTIYGSDNTCVCENLSKPEGIRPHAKLNHRRKMYLRARTHTHTYVYILKWN